MGDIKFRYKIVYLLRMVDSFQRHVAFTVRECVVRQFVEDPTMDTHLVSYLTKLIAARRHLRLQLS